MRVVLAYDVADDKRRARLVKLLRQHGYRVQESVFEADVEEEELRAVVKKGLKLLKLAEDSLRVYRLCAACLGRVDAYGRTIEDGTEEDVLVV